MSGRLLAALLLIITCNACQTEARIMNTSSKIDALFAKTKPLCFGRFLMDIPENSIFVAGGQTFGADIETIDDSKMIDRLARKKYEQIVARSKTIDGSEVNEFERRGEGWILYFWDSDSAKYVGVLNSWEYFKRNSVGFVYKNITGDKETEDEIAKQNLYVANNLRARQPDEIPTEPGVCLDLGFIKDDSGKFQEIFNIGLRFPSMPDVSFSISSNKDARRDSSFEERRSEARKAALLYAPLATLFSKVKTLREGKHKVYKWQGDEALFRHPLDEGKGVWHEFQFEYAGIRYDHHNPGWDATLFSGVKDDEAGAQASSLSDEEAIELWDRLLSTVRLRVPE